MMFDMVVNIIVVHLRNIKSYFLKGLQGNETVFLRCKKLISLQMKEVEKGKSEKNPERWRGGG